MILTDQEWCSVTINLVTRLITRKVGAICSQLVNNFAEEHMINYAPLQELKQLLLPGNWST